jgi:hypothetical protein
MPSVTSLLALAGFLAIGALADQAVLGGNSLARIRKAIAQEALIGSANGAKHRTHGFRRFPLAFTYEVAYADYWEDVAVA